MKYRAQFDGNVGPEDAEAGRCYDVLHAQNWQDGRYLPPLCQRCTLEDAERIVRGLEALEHLELLCRAGVDLTIVVPT